MENKKSINDHILLKYINFEYLLYKRKFSSIFSSKQLKDLYLKEEVKYSAQIATNHLDLLYSKLRKSKNIEGCPVFEGLISNFLSLINDETEKILFEIKNKQKNKRKRIREINYKKSNESKDNDKEVLNNKVKEKKDHEEKKSPSGYQEVNDFVLNLIKFDKELMLKFDELHEDYQTLIICFTYSVLYKDFLYNLFVNKPSSLNKIPFLRDQFKSLRDNNLDILLFKFSKNAENSKIEKKICKYNPKLISILEAFDDKNFGKPSKPRNK